MHVRELSTAGASILVHRRRESAVEAAVDLVLGAIDSARAERGKAVIGLPTGTTPLPLYDRMVARHRSGSCSFKNVSTYNLDEYYPISPFDPNSYRRYMWNRLFAHVDVAPDRAHVFDGTVPRAFVAEHAAQYDRWIEAEGGLDLQLLGIGRNGHIGFNEPSDLSVESALNLPSRLAALHPITREDAVVDFGKLEAVPTEALTLGLKPIFASRVLMILAFGAKKADVVRASLLGPITARLPGTLLRASGAKVLWILDEEAAAGLPADGQSSASSSDFRS